MPSHYPETEKQLQPFTFGELVKVHNRVRKEIPTLAEMDLPTFSRLMNESTGTQAFNMGLSDSRVKRVSAAVNRVLEPVAEKTGDFGAWLTDLVLPQHKELGRMVGESIPRGIVETLPVLGGAAMLGTPVAPLGATLMAGGAGLAAAGTYEQTDSPAAAGVVGGLTAAIPGFASVGRKVVTPLLKKAFYDPVTINLPMLGKTVSAFRPSTAVNPKVAGMAERALEYAGENVGMAVNQELALQSVNMLTGQGILGLTPEHVAMMVGGQVPFALLDAFRIIKGPSVEIGEPLISNQATRRRVDFRSRTEAEMFQQYLAGEQAAVLHDQANQIKRAYNTLKKTIPPSHQLPAPKSVQMPDSPLAKKAGDLGTVDVSTDKIREALSGGPMDVAIARDYNKALRILGEKDEISDFDLMALGISDANLPKVKDRLANRGYIERTGVTIDEPMQGAFRAGATMRSKVVAQPTDPSQVLQEAINFYFAATGKPKVDAPPVLKEAPVSQPAAEPAPSGEWLDSFRAEVGKGSTLLQSFKKVKDLPGADYMSALAEYKKLRPDARVSEEELPSFISGDKSWKARLMMGITDGLTFDQAYEKVKTLVGKGEAKRWFNQARPIVPAEGLVMPTRPGEPPKGTMTQVPPEPLAQPQIGFQPGLFERTIRDVGTQPETLAARDAALAKYASPGEVIPPEEGNVVKLPPQDVDPNEAQLERMRLSRGGEIDQLTAQFLQKFELTAAERLSKPTVEMTLEERYALADEMTESLHSILTEAVGTHLYRSYLRNKQEMSSAMDGMVKMGMSPMEAASRIYNAQMVELGQVLRVVDQTQQVLSSKERAHIQKAHDIIQERLKRLGELTETEQQAIVRVLMRPWFRFGKGAFTDATPYVLAAAVQFKDSPDIQTRMIEKIKRDPNYERLSDEEVRLTAMSEWAASRGVFKTYRDLSREKMLVLTDEEMRDTGIVKETTAEEAMAREAAEEAASEQAVDVRRTVPLKTYTLLEVQKGLVADGQPMIQRGAGEKADLFNKLLVKFFNNEITFAPDALDPKKIVARPLVGWKALADQFGMKERTLSDFFASVFVPAIRGIYKQSKTGLHEMSVSRDQGAALAQSNRLDPRIVSDNWHSLHTSAVTAKRFFRTYFLGKKGLTPAEAEAYSDVAVKVASAFMDVGFTRIAEVVGPSRVAGFYWEGSQTRLNNLIGVASRDFTDSPAFNRFQKLQTLGHELWHALVDMRTRMKLSPDKAAMIDQVFEWASGLSDQERSDTYNYWFDIVVPKKVVSESEDAIERFAGARMDFSEMDVREFVADLAGALVLGVVSPDKLTKVGVRDSDTFLGKELMFSSSHEQQFAKGLFLPLHDVFEATYDYLRAFGVSEESAHNVDRIMQTTKRVLKDLHFAEKAANALRHMEQYDPVNYDRIMTRGEVNPFSYQDFFSFASKYGRTGVHSQVWGDAVKAASDFLGFSEKRELEKNLGIHPNWFDKWFTPFAQLAKFYPHLQPVYDLARGFRSLANDAAMKMLSPFLAKTGILGRVHLDVERTGLRMISKNPKLDRFATEIALYKNEVERVLTDDEMKRMMPGVGEDQQKAVIDFHRAVEQSMPLAAELIIKFERDGIANMAASFLMAENKQLRFKDVVQLSKQMYAGFIGQNALNPAEQQLAVQQLLAVQQAVGPRAFEAAHTFMKNANPYVEKLAEALSNKPWFTPELRLGQYQVAWKRADGTAGSIATDSFEEALAHKQKIAAEGARVRIWDRYDKRNAMSGLHPDLVEKYRDIEQSVYKRAVEDLTKIDPRAAEVFQKFNYNPGSRVMEEVKAQSTGRFLLKRDLAEGRETTSVTQGIVHYISGLSTGLAKKYTKEQAALALRDPELLANPKLQELGRQHLSNVIEPTSKEWTTFKNLNFAYFLGFNFSSMLIEGSQSVLTLIPQLTRDSGSLASSYRYWGRAVSEFLDTAKNGWKYTDAELQAAIERARREQRIDFGIMQEFHQFDENIIPNLRNLVVGNDKVLKAEEMVKKPLYWYLNTARTLYSIFPRANAQLSFVAAYRLGKEKLGLSGEQLYQYAIQTTDVTSFGGGQANRPVAPFYNMGRAHGAMGVMYSLQTYTYSTIAMMARLGREAISTSDRIPKDQKRAALKAFGQALLTQTALGGALSLPLGAGVVALLEQVFPELELKRDIRELFASLAGDDDEMGQLVADLALKGIPTVMLGVDISSRLGLSSILGVSPYNGFSLGHLVGPTGSVIENLVRGVSDISTGKVGDGLESMLPVAYKNIVRLYNDQFDLRDRSGRLIAELTPSQVMLQSIGLKTKALSDYQESAALKARSEDVEKLELDQFHKELAQLLESGRPADVLTALRNKHSTDPLYDPVSGARRVTEIVVDRSTPVDLSRTGARTTAAERAALLATYGQTPQPTELQRLQQRNGLMTQLGIPVTVGRAEMTRAAMVDNLMRMNPRMTRQEALVIVERALSRRATAEAVFGLGVGTGM